MKYSIVIPTYNHCNDLLKPCLDAIFKYSSISDIEVIVSANGCTDNTFEYLGKIKETFNQLDLADHFKVVWHKEALGYARATNAGIRVSTAPKVVLLNNDAILLPQAKNDWLNLLNGAFDDPKCGISCSLKKYSEIIRMYFGLFFCVMIDRKLFNEVGLLDERYETGGNEDIDFCAAAQLLGYELIQPVPINWDPNAQMHVGTFPLWHRGEGTVHDPNLVSDWERTFRTNELKLALKYNNIEWYEAHKDTV
jgi:GT2 family glycosyltransferase